MKLYIDITKLLSVPYLTGIQRVVREVVLRMLQQNNMEIVLLSYNEGYHIYEQVDNQSFIAYYDKGEGKQNDCITEHVIDWKELQPGDIFFDIDGVWNLPLRRSVLLPRLKANGVKLAVYVYDIIPVTHPQFCHGETIHNFMNYISAYLQYADIIIASAQSTLDVIAELLEQLKLPPVPGAVSWLGSDFRVKETEAEEIHPEAVKAVEAGTYVLMVGTIEPRKNHGLVLDAFDSLLFEKGVNLIFVGRIGWNVEAFRKRMDKHPKRNRQFFYLQGMNDATIDYLYKNAYCVAFPTFNEGFGLPIIEAFQRGTPVLASDIPVLREVGGSSCAYFDLSSWRNFADMLLQWMEHPEQYDACKKQIQSYVPVTWDTVTDKIWEALYTLKDEYPYAVPAQIRQMVYLTARMEDLLESLPFVEHFMPFIEELVLCCPDSMIEPMKQQYTGRCRIRFLSDSELLNGTELPKDHTKRNFYLRCLAMKQTILDDVFIMADDDYRPLAPIAQEVFLKDGMYQGYYCYHLEEWKGDQKNPTSFDLSMHRTNEFLNSHGYSTWMYDAHMPQVIDRRVFLELLKKHPEIEHLGLSDWSVYFNFLNTMYSGQIVNHPFVTLAWPGIPSAWDMTIFPQRLLFENYYRELYEEGEIFEGFSQTYYDGIEQENMEKIVRYLNGQADHNQARAMFQAYCSNYEMLYGECPIFDLHITEDSCEIRLPEYLAICESNFTRIPFGVDYPEDIEASIELSYNILDVRKQSLLEGERMNFRLNQNRIEVPMKGTHGGMKVILELCVKYRDIEYKQYTKLCVMKKGF